MRLLVDDYDVGPVLGTGGFSVVRVGVRKQDHLQVAIKTVKKFGYRSSGGREPQRMSQAEALVKNEILVMARIVDRVAPHPNVIHQVDVYEDADGVHLVLELCRGKELFDRIVEQERYSERDAAAVVRQIAAGLAALHQAHIVHRDLRPENCLFVDAHPQSALKVMDFGLSYIHGVTNAVVGIFGSIDYMAPEQLNLSAVSPANDMWSLGVILYILLCGYPPFRAKTSRDKQIQILTGSYSMEEQSWRGISSEAKELIKRLLAVDPSHRPTASELLSHQWVSGDTAIRELIHEDVFMRLQSFNARRKFRATAYASIVRTKFQLRTKYLKELLGDRVLTEAELEALRVTFLSMRQAILDQRRALPISSVESELVDLVKKNDTLVVIGETGSGKTTQLPQFLHSAGFCNGGMMVGITQPRRVAAITVATRVAEEMGVEVGKEVGYSIRFEDCTSTSTQLKYMTDGMLLREALLDPLLSRYSLIVIDEAHERTIHTDVLFGLLKGVQSRRQAASTATTSSKQKAGKAGDSLKDLKNLLATRTEKKLSPLKLVVMSATLDTKGFCEYFNGAEAVYVQGRQFPVEIFYTFTPEADYLDAALLTTFQIHLEETAGDILLFLTGQEEIESMERLLKERASHLSQNVQKLLVVPIYAALPSEQQMRVFQAAPDGTRKVILATNIAETSLTIPGIRYVIDPGLVKARAFNPRTGVESLEVVPVSKAQAQQRSGRAGRERPGKCFRLYTEDLFTKLVPTTVPEIQRCNLANVVLQLKAFGIDDVLGFDFMDKPSRISIVKSLEHLYSLGALTDEGKLSDPIGVRMSRFPLEPMFAKAMLISCDMGCSAEMLATVSMMSVDSVFYAPRDKLQEANNARKRFVSVEGDHITFINVLRHYIQETVEAGAESGEGEGTSSNSTANENKKAFKRIRSWCAANFINARSLRRAVDIQKQIRGYVEGMGLKITSCGEDTLSFRRCLAASFFLNAARRQLDGTYRALASGQSVAIHPSSVLFGKKPDCVVFNELVRTNRSYIRNITQVDSLWLPELAPHYYAAQGLHTPSQQQR